MRIFNHIVEKAKHLLGLSRKRKCETAIIKQEIANASLQEVKNHLAFFNEGNILFGQQKFADAIKRYDSALLIKHDFAEVYCNRGAALYCLQRFEEAIESYNNAIRIKPDYVDAYCNRGVTLQALQQLEAALQSYDCAIRFHANHADAHYNRGNAMRELGRIPEALESYKEAIRLNPNHLGAQFNLGVVFQALGQFEAAIKSYTNVIQAKSDYAEVYFNRGNVLQLIGKFEEAIEDYRQAVKISPGYVDAYSNCGNALQASAKLEEAIASYNNAIRLAPHYAEAYYNRGVAHEDLFQLQEAIESYGSAIAINANYADARFNQSLLRLLQGDFHQGFALYESRWKAERAGLKQRQFSEPLWLGRESIYGKKILLYSEQGLGDTIQFIRYAKRIAAQGAYVIAEVPETLMRLFQGMEGVSECLAFGKKLPVFDFHCPLLSLPLALKTDLATIPISTAYLYSDKIKLAEWSGRLGTKTFPRVGLMWSGNPEHKNDHRRSIALSVMREALSSGFEYISLQKQVRDSDQNALDAQGGIRHFGDELKDFSDTAALCDLMDVVISVDTSVAHLSAAMGKPTWILLPYIPDWRWMMDREDSPWYPSVKLYRQGADREWGSVLNKVRQKLTTISSHTA